jgi:nucleotide-binding universal stress UspA family protein
MSSIKNILVPVDFSKCSGAAMTFALEMAQCCGAQVHALHVVNLNEQIEDRMDGDMWFDEYFERRWHDLDHWVERFRKKEAFKTISITTSCEIGFLSVVIKTVARNKQADLIVMGTTGATGLRAMFMGSNTVGVISAVQIPVLAIPEKMVFQLNADYVLATDYGLDLDTHSWEVLGTILNIQQAGLQVLHILNTLGEQADKSLKNQITEHLGNIDCKFRYLREENVRKAVSEHIDAVGAIGLIVIAHQHSFLHKLVYRSTSKSLVKKARTAILILHDRVIE